MQEIKVDGKNRIQYTVNAHRRVDCSIEAMAG